MERRSFATTETGEEELGVEKRRDEHEDIGEKEFSLILRKGMVYFLKCSQPIAAPREEKHKKKLEKNFKMKSNVCEPIVR